MISSLKDVAMVVRQETLDYVPNLLKYRPDYVVHGDDWRASEQIQFAQLDADLALTYKDFYVI